MNRMRHNSVLQSNHVFYVLSLCLHLRFLQKCVNTFVFSVFRSLSTLVLYICVCFRVCVCACSRVGKCMKVVFIDTRDANVMLMLILMWILAYAPQNFWSIFTTYSHTMCRIFHWIFHRSTLARTLSLSFYILLHTAVMVGRMLLLHVQRVL